MALATTSVLFAIASCPHDKTDTDNFDSNVEVITTCTTTSTTTSTLQNTTTTESTTTTSTTTTTELMTTTDTMATTIVSVNTPVIETQPYVVEVTTEVVESQPVEVDSSLPISDREYELLCKIVASEYGGMSDVGERAKIVASIMNQSYRTGQSIESCLYTSCVPWGFCPDNTWYCSGSVYYGDMADAVDYYFANQNTVFGDWQADSWYASGYGTNVFHRQLW